MKKLFGLNCVPLYPDLGLLFFRVILSAVVIRFHGWGKLTGWVDESWRIPNLFALAGFRKEFHSFPNYIGISSEVSYLLVTWFETFGSMMIIFGLFARFNALGMFITLAVAWYAHHHMHFSGPNGGEVPFVYAFGYLLLFLAGSGRYSLDRALGVAKV
jgi:uncharacterized membrane protein YphA (DoxX/SURF4 family)